MLEQVCARLRARALAVQELHLNLELAATQPNDYASFADAPTRPLARLLPRKFIRTLRLPTPMLDAKVFLKLLQLDLQAHPPGAPIVKIHLSAEPVRPRALQSGLFQPFFPEPEKLELTLARIAGIVGEGRVGSVELLDTHREGAFAVRHFAPAEPKLDQNVKKSAKEQMSAVIVLRLFRPPLGAVVTLREAKPVRIRCLQREDIAGEIVWSAGPWRSSGDWSDQEGWSREEWDVAVPSETGLVLYRLVQDKLSGNWFVEGMYD